MLSPKAAQADGAPFGARAAGKQSLSHAEGHFSFGRQVELSKMCHDKYNQYEHLTSSSPRKGNRGMEESLLEDSVLAEFGDPSLLEGHSVVYDRECPFELRVEEIDEAGALEPIRCKVLVLGSREHPENCRIELSSERDIFFHYIHNVDEQSFLRLQDRHKLHINFSEYVSFLIKMLNTCITEPHLQLAIFVMQRAGSARLDFVRNLGLKFAELLTCDFEAATEELVRQHINHRYNSMKSRTISTQARLENLMQLVYIKNPALKCHIEKILKKTNASRFQSSPRKPFNMVTLGVRRSGSRAEIPLDASSILDSRRTGSRVESPLEPSFESRRTKSCAETTLENAFYPRTRGTI
mmetsp:Transcript_142632/g.251772  ORF Transcript_142632/g.251772 Transcript_142632/m.251772 type:complete len:353 (-) Transcript_142632:15-1073(-)